jgi:hypothetical protein
MVLRERISQLLSALDAFIEGTREALAADIDSRDADTR